MTATQILASVLCAAMSVRELDRVTWPAGTYAALYAIAIYGLWVAVPDNRIRHERTHGYLALSLCDLDE